MEELNLTLDWLFLFPEPFGLVAVYVDRVGNPSGIVRELGVDGLRDGVGFLREEMLDFVGSDRPLRLPPLPAFDSRR
jgi:hypothetical protein